MARASAKWSDRDRAKLYAARFGQQELKEDTLAPLQVAAGRKLLAEEPVIADQSMSAHMGTDEALGRSRQQDARRDEESAVTRFSPQRESSKMAARDVDLFVIGAGSGGVRAARIAAGYGARVMLAEEYRVGGTCVIRGCVPKKLLVYASRFRRRVRGRGRLRLDASAEPDFDWATLIANKDREIARLEAAYTANLERAKVDDRQEPRGAGGRAHGAAARRPARRCAPGTS